MSPRKPPWELRQPEGGDIKITEWLPGAEMTPLTHPRVLSGAERHPPNRVVTSGDSVDYLKKLTAVLSEEAALGATEPPAACVRLLPPTWSCAGRRPGSCGFSLWSISPADSATVFLCFPWPPCAGFVTASWLVHSSALSRGSATHTAAGWPMRSGSPVQDPKVMPLSDPPGHSTRTNLAACFSSALLCVPAPCRLRVPGSLFLYRNRRLFVSPGLEPQLAFSGSNWL